MRVLIAEDDPISCRVLESTLRKWEFDPVAVADGQAAWEALQEEQGPRLAILDWEMPGLNGIDVCRRLRQHGGDYVYVILLTARASREDMVVGLDHGADDYIVKPFDVGELKVRLRAARRILDLQTELISARESLHDRATHDDLTGLWNRRAVLDSFQRELDRSQRECRPISLIVADVDHFKRVNDDYGHHVGDIVLRAVAERMSHVMRPYDRVGRYGGEEFLMVVPGCETSFAGFVAERVRTAVADEPIIVDGLELPVTVSLGVTGKTHAGPADADRMIQAADEAMYEAKRAGRNCVRIARPAAVPAERAS
ncbi:MAG: GGDEF domain-containing response regulator [Planctomycetota bacterium]|jgi:diguanylate cyclase (GGDEF)-like protein